MCERSYICNPATYIYENDKYLESIFANSLITCDGIKETTKTVPTGSTSAKTVPAKINSTNFYIILTFLLITVTFFITVSIHLIKDWSS